MMSTIKKALLTAAVLVPTALFVPAASAQVSTETFRISNDSGFRIDRIYMTPSNYRTWGQDRLSGYLSPGYQVDLNVYPGRYDVRVVDKDNDECVISGVDVYEGKVWHLNNVALLACELRSAR